MNMYAFLAFLGAFGSFFFFNFAAFFSSMSFLFSAFFSSFNLILSAFFSSLIFCFSSFFSALLADLSNGHIWTFNLEFLSQFITKEHVCISGVFGSVRVSFLFPRQRA